MFQRPFLLRLLRSRPGRLAQLGAGILLVVFGPLLGWPLPGPFGFMMWIAGITLVLRNSLWSRRRYVMLKRRNPKLGKRADWAMRRGSAKARDRRDAKTAVPQPPAI